MSIAKIGKDVIESLTLGMYEDSRFIFREYIQNSADQIDKAVELGIIKNRNEGNIYIEIDPINNKIIFEDDATGIKSNEFSNVLKDIAQSTKDRGKHKGFRGIGRLGGLGYCDKLTFESSYVGEDSKSIMVWDAKGLKDIINDRTKKEEATEVIETITKTTTETEHKEKHYFKVILENVTDPELLDVCEVREYLSMVSPVPFEGHFVFKNLIIKELEDNNLSIDEYKVYINTEQLYKAYKTTIKDNNGNNKDEIFDVKFKLIEYKNNVIGFLWYGISKAIEQIPAKHNPARGFRLRKGNIQIGNEFTLSKFHREDRFNQYFLGEIHAFSPDLIPNARRDYFLDNKVCKAFESEIKNFFANDIGKITRVASDINSANRKILIFEKVKNDFKETQQKGFSSKEEKEKLINAFNDSKAKAEEAKDKLERQKKKIEGNDVLSKIYDKVVTTDKNEPKKDDISHDVENGKTKYRTDNLSKLNKNERKLVSRIYQVIDDKLTPDLAENLKYWIEEDFK